MLARCRFIIIILTLVTGLGSASGVLALGLGELTLDSGLNQPLDASIQILDLGGLNDSQVQVSMGQEEDFERAGIERLAVIDDIDFEVEVLSASDGVLRITTARPVVEPFLNFIVSVRWPNGRLLREYTVLLDLPGTAPSTPVTATEPPGPPQNAPAQPGPQQAATPPAGNTTPPVPSVTRSVTVQPGDTLYNLALENRPDNSVSVQQTMVAIQRANPNAFSNNNINRVRTGEVLRIPGIQDIRAISQGEAERLIADQNRQAGNQPLGVNNAIAPGGAQNNSDELSILTGEDGEVSGDAGLAETIAALENQLMISEENLDRARLENQELTARFADLEAQIEILQNIIAIEDERIAQLQAELAAQAAATQAALAEAQAVASNPPPPDDSLMGRLSAIFQNTIVLLSSLLALVLVVLGFLIWRRRAAEGEMDEFAMAGAAAPVQAEADALDDETSGGFLAALKARFARSGGVDDDDGEDDEEADEDAVAADGAEDHEMPADAEDLDEDEESPGLLDRIRGFFGRGREEDEDDFDEDDVDAASTEAEAPGVEPGDDEKDAPGDDYDDADDELDDEDDDDDYDDADEEEADDVDVIYDDEVREADGEADATETAEADTLDDEDADLEALDEFLFDEEVDDAAGSAVSEEAREEAVPASGAEVLTAGTAEGEADEVPDSLDDGDLDVGLGDDDGNEDDVPPTVNLADADEPAEAEAAVESVDDDMDSLEFGLAEETDSTEAAEVEDAEAESVESFEFSLSETDAEPTAETGEDIAEDLESFEFKVEEDAGQAEPSAGEGPAEDVETLEFDVGSISSFEEEPSADDEAPQEFETFSFEPAEDTDPSAEESADAGVLEITEVDDDDGLDTLDLAAALDQIDAEAEKPASGSRADDDLDLGNIDIDDSLFEPDEEDGDTVEPITDRDESSTKLDLAVAYEAMGDLEGAREILEEVIAEGSEEQIAEARKLLDKWDQDA